MPKVRVRGDLGIPGVAKGSIEIEGDSCKDAFDELRRCLSEARMELRKIGLGLVKRLRTELKHKLR